MTDAIHIVYTPDEDFILSKKDIGNSGGGSSELPIATESKLGGVKIGEGINVTSDGTISASGGGGGGTLVVNVSLEDYVWNVLDKTALEVYNAMLSGAVLVHTVTYDGEHQYEYMATCFPGDDEEIGYSFTTVFQTYTFQAALSSDYPRCIAE